MNKNILLIYDGYQQLKEQIIELRLKYEKTVKEKDDEVYDLERQICNNGGKIRPSYLKNK